MYNGGCIIRKKHNVKVDAMSSDFGVRIKSFEI